MEKRIIYENNDGGVAIIIPTPEALKAMIIEELKALDISNV
jgi:hypothetical protein